MRWEMGLMGIIRGVLMLLILLIIKATVFAKEVFEPLHEIVVTTSRIEEPKSEVSSFVQTLSKDAIELSFANDVGNLMLRAGLGHVHKYPGFLTSRIAVRGLTTDLFDLHKSRVLVLIDGVLAGTVNLKKFL
ncbi:MAG: hypothetical protein RMI63_06260 [Caldimicrobium sp.]|nr:hypothetical protein [Caldimicrobium sp.]